MSDFKLLTGEQLLEKGASKQETTLPTRGAKNVLPSGSWLEQKQVQAALEARKHLLEDERVEKWGVLSHAEWDEQLQLARVIEHRGSHWSYLGHNVGKQLFLYPEEALFLMEVNCLELKFGDVQVSLQQAYSLLLSGTITILEYKVYSELSRVGYRVLRTNPDRVGVGENLMECEKQINLGQHLNRKSKESNRTDTEITDQITDKSTNENKLHKEIKCNVSDTESYALGLDNENGSLISETDQQSQISESEKGSQILVKDHKCQIAEMENKSQISEIDNDVQTEEKDKSDNSYLKELNENLEGNDKLSECYNNKTLALEIDGMGETDATYGVECNSVEASPVAAAATVSADWRALPPILVSEPKSWVFCDLTNERDERMCKRPKETNPYEVSCSNTVTPETRIPSKSKTSSKLYRGHKRNTTKVLSTLNLPDYFQSVSNIQGKDTVTMNAPDEAHLPRNVFLNQTAYTLKISKITRNERPTRSNSSGDSHNNTNMDDVRCLQSGPRPDPPRMPFHANIRPPQPFFPLQQFLPSLMHYPYFLLHNQYRFNNMCRVPTFFPHHRNFLPRYNMPFQRNNSAPTSMMQEEEMSSRKRPHDLHRKQEHLQAIRKLAYRLKQFLKSGNRNEQNLNSLHRLIQSFNSRYNEKIQLSEHCTLVNDCNENDTIDLEKDERDRKIRRRNNSEPDSQRNKFLENLKSLAFRLKQMKSSGESHFRARRHLLKAIKTFNKKFKCNVYLTANFGIKDNQQVVLDSSSDSDCVITGNPEIRTKKLKNPLNAVKTKQKFKQLNTNEPEASTSKQPTTDEPLPAVCAVEQFYNKFGSMFKGWLPRVEDWGRAEVVPAWSCHNRLLNSNQNQYLFENFKGFLDQFKCWPDLKTEYWNSLEDNAMDVDAPEETPNEALSGPQPLLRPEDCDNMASVLKRLGIIKTFKVAPGETLFKVQFDVYERDVKNFRKSDLPTPDFRTIGLSEDSPMPDVSEVISLQQQYADGAPLVVAVVGVGSVSYMQMSASDLPIYLKQTLI